MRKLIFIWLLIVVGFSVIEAQTVKTVVKDKAAKTRLLGAHRFSLQWISWDYFGKATVTERAGVLRIKGEQKSRTDSDFVTIDGVITEVAAKEFKFDGKIVTKVSHNNNDEPCVREGEMTFKATGNRRYWRLQEMLNPCTNVETDYVDVYFRK